MKKFKNNLSIIIIIVFLSIAFILLTTFLVDNRIIKLDNNVNIIAIFNLYITLIITLFLIRYLNKKEKEISIIRNYFINLLSDFHREFKTEIRHILYDHLPYTQVIPTFKKLYTKYQAFYDIISEHYTYNSKYQELFKSPIKIIISLRKEITQAKVQNKKYILTSKIEQNITKYLQEMEKAIYNILLILIKRL